MFTLYDFASMPIAEKRKWEIAHSSFIRLKEATYEECRNYACESITNGITKISVGKGEIVEIPYETPFNFIGRVDTSMSDCNPMWYYQTYKTRTFISYSTICNQNVSHYEGDIFFVYNINPEDIVHIFPMDSGTDIYASEERDLTVLPSLWLSLQNLNNLTRQLGVYNQITIRTKRNGEIYKPVAIVAFEHTSDKIQEIANLFEVGTIIVHPDKKAVYYDKDLLHDYFKLMSVSRTIEKLYGFPVISMYFHD